MIKTILAALGATTLAATAAAQMTADTPPQPRPHGMGVGALLRADLNHDGVVTRAEASAEADQRFATTDTDHDRKVTADERRAAAARQQAAHAERHGVPPRPEGAPPPAGAAPGDLGFAGQRGGMGGAGGRGGRDLTQAEFRGRALRLFDRADTNHDGTVDRNEVDAMRLVLRARLSGEGAPPARDDQ